MKKIMFFCILLVVCSIGTTQATMLTLELNSAFPTKADPDGSSPWLTATFDDDTGSANTVDLTLAASLSTSPNNKVGSWSFNFDPAENPLNLSIGFDSKSGTFTNPTVTTGTDFFQADGDGKFDINFDFVTSSGNEFNDNDWIKYTLTYPTAINVSYFNYFSTPQGGEGTWITAAHIQDISHPDGSTWIGADEGSSGNGDGDGDGNGNAPVPEPATMLLFGTGLAGLAGTKMRRKEK